MEKTPTQQVWLVCEKGAFVPRPGPCFVHSVFARACNVSFPKHGLLALLNPGLPMAAWAFRLLVEQPSFRSFLREGESGFWDGSRLSFASLCIETKEAHLWQKDHVPSFNGEPKMLAKITEILKMRDWPGLTVFLPLMLGRSVQRRAREDAFWLPYALEKIQELREAQLQKDAVVMATAAQKLIGLGPGLTPAGDDFMGGYLAALFARRPLGVADPILKTMVTHLLAAETSPVAAMYLRLACQGSFSEYLVNLVSALQRGEGVQEACERLMAFGASSGADTLAGLILGLWPNGTSA